VLDRYLARTGYESQQTDEVKPDDQPANLWEPADVERDYGAHGAFDDRSSPSSTPLWASQHHGLLAAGTALAGAAAALALLRRTAR
jgi:hypothetical protein